MIPSLHCLLGGYRVFSADRRNAAPLLELCRRHTILYEDFRHLPDGGIVLRFPRSSARRLLPLCARHGVILTPVGEGGLPGLGRFLLRRAGLPIGFCLGLWLLIASQRVVWDVRVSGNTHLSDRTIEQSLEACGFGVGTPLRGFEADKTENEVLLYDDRLAWISINRKGTVAYVEVREREARPPEEEDTPCDIVAAMGGIIQRVELTEGNVRVTAGQAVGVGDILVSGLYDSQTQGIRITAARARVYARTTRILTVDIPLSYEQKVYEAPAAREKSVNFFGNHIKFSKKAGNPGGLCDIIEEERSWGLPMGETAFTREVGFPGEVGFPVSSCTLWYLPYRIETHTRTYAEAEELAYLELARRIAAIPGGAELIGKTVTVRHGEETLTLTCTLTCVEDIGRVRIIEVGNSP